MTVHVVLESCIYEDGSLAECEPTKVFKSLEEATEYCEYMANKTKWYSDKWDYQCRSLELE